MLFNKSQTKQQQDAVTEQPNKALKDMLSIDLSTDRLLALGLLASILLLVYLLVISPLLKMGDTSNERKDDLAFRLQRYKRTIASKDDIYKNAEKIKRQYNSQGYLSTHDTASLASANLQTFIKNSIKKAGGQLTSTQALPKKDEEVFTRITVKVRMTANMEVLRTILHEIETSTPVITIEQLDIRPVRGKRNRKTRKIENSNKLNINFQASSFMRHKS
jgi:general secretion pathway protein M